nr:PREDICTED: uncharacterized protein LOC108198327 [Daucus carota subsp. sativus]
MRHGFRTRIGDIREVKNKICLAIENQYQEIKTRIASEKIDRNEDIDILLEEFRAKYHKQPLVQKEDIKRQITLFLDAPAPTTLEPQIIPHKGRPVGAKNKKNKSSTTRDHSAFELQDLRKCSMCQGIGHNSRTCSMKKQHPHEKAV